MFDISDKSMKHLGYLGASFLVIAAVTTFWILIGIVAGKLNGQLIIPTLGIGLFGAYALSVKSMLQSTKKNACKGKQ